MNPNTLKIVGLTAVIIFALGSLLYFGFQGTSSGAGALPSLQQEIKARDHSIDSVGKLSQRQQQQIDSLRGQLQIFQTRDSTWTQKVNFLQSDRQRIIKRYETLARYDTISAHDIQRYLSDSLCYNP